MLERGGDTKGVKSVPSIFGENSCAGRWIEIIVSSIFQGKFVRWPFDKNLMRCTISSRYYVLTKGGLSIMVGARVKNFVC